MGRKGNLETTLNDPLVQWIVSKGKEYGCQTQIELGALIGLPQSAVNKILLGRTQVRNIRVKTWQNIFAVFGYPPTHLNPFNPPKETKL